MRIVIDTNVVASGIFFGGKPGKLLEMVVSKELDAYVSEDIFTEYQETLEELCSRYPSRPPRLPLSNLLTAMKIIQPHSQVQVCRDHSLNAHWTPNAFTSSAAIRICCLSVNTKESGLSQSRNSLPNSFTQPHSFRNGHGQPRPFLFPN